MQATIKVEQTVEIKLVHISICIRDPEEEASLDLPWLNGNQWEVFIDIDTGQIQDWPESDKPYSISSKVRDSGAYRLLDKDGNIVASILQNYVPNKLIPGEYGDYIDLEINETGLITNWPSDPSVEEFFEDND